MVTAPQSYRLTASPAYWPVCIKAQHRLHTLNNNTRHMATQTAAQQQEALLRSMFTAEQLEQYEILLNVKKEEKASANRKVNPKREELARNMVDKLQRPLEDVLALQKKIFDDSDLEKMTIRNKKTNALVKPIVDLCTKIMDGAMGPRPQKRKSDASDDTTSGASGESNEESKTSKKRKKQ